MDPATKKAFANLEKQVAALTREVEGLKDDAATMRTTIGVMKRLADLYFLIHGDISFVQGFIVQTLTPREMTRDATTLEPAREVLTALKRFGRNWKVLARTTDELRET